MKKYVSLAIVIAAAFLLTGCVKYNVTMDIKKDKSMDFKIIYAIDKDLLEGQEVMSKEDIKKIEKQGFEVKNYSEDKMEGFTLTKKIKNIDEVSAEKATEYSLSGIVQDKNKSTKMFKVKKGFFKNKYSADLDFNTSDSTLDNDDTEAVTEDETTKEEVAEEPTTTEEVTNTEETTEDNTDLSGMEEYTKNMDLSVNVNLPYKNLKNNATKVSKDGKELNWDLVKDSDKTKIEFEFELYNMTNIYICVGAAVAVLIIIIVVVVATKGNKTTTKEEKEDK